MKYLSVYVVLFFLAFHTCYAQYTISGRLTDTLNQTPLPQASVVLIRSADSVMENFTRSKDDGTFIINAQKEGSYTVLITFPNFADYTDNIVLKDNQPISLGNITMVSRTHLLNEFVITQQIAAIKIKGDTTEFMADSFKVKDNATVEDLLKKLPGLQVDKNGKVTAQGEEVKKILVDGEEFFSDDPAVVTKNLQSSIVERVQVYDKKSDQTEFTGIDDGQKTKTINLQLKENKKKGYFGKIDAGGGTDGYFQNQAMINNFVGKRQLSAFGIASNTDQVGLGWGDNSKYSSSDMNTEITDGGDVITYFSSNSDNDFQSWDGKYGGEGLPRIFTGGLHFADKWNEDKEHVTGNYRYALQDVEISGDNITQNILPDNTQNITRQHREQFSSGQRHSADGMYEWKIDTTATLKLTVTGGYKNTTTNSDYNTDIFYDNPASGIDSLINNTRRRVTSTAASQNLNSDLLYRKKFAKKGRTLSIDIKENYKDGNSSGYLNSVSTFAGGDSVTDQRKKIETHTLAFAGKATYTEPLAKKTFLELDYGLSLNNSRAINSSYDKPAGADIYNMLDTLYSSNYTFNVLTNTGGANLRFVYDKVNFSFGSDVSNARYKQRDMLYKDTTYDYNYLNLFPKAAFKYKFGKQNQPVYQLPGQHQAANYRPDTALTAKHRPAECRSGQP